MENLHDWTKKRIVIAKALGGALALVGATWVVSSNPAFADTGHFYVNMGGNDANPCTKLAPCATITRAIDVAAPGDTIRVGSGTYPEQLIISKPLTIVGASPTATIIEPSSPTTTQTLASDTDPDASVPDYPIIDVTPGTTGVLIKRLEVDGANAQTPFDNCSAGNFVGIYFHDASGLVKGVHVIGMEFPPADFGCQTSVGVGVLAASDGADPSNVTLQGLRVNNYGKNGIQCDDGDTTCTLQNNVVTGIGPTPLTAQNGILIWGGNATTVTGNHVKGDSYTGGGDWEPYATNAASGILVVNAANVTVSGNMVHACDVDIALAEDPTFGHVPVDGYGAWTITHNTANKAVDNVAGGLPGPPTDSNPGSGYGDGIEIQATATPTHTVTVSHNYVSRNFEFGIALLGATDATVQDNFGQADYDGLYVGGPGSAVGATTSKGNMVSGNTFVSERNDGIWADSYSAGNNITGNILRNSVSHQAEDTSTGGGTAATANTWSSNVCTPLRINLTSPAGLCS